MSGIGCESDGTATTAKFFAYNAIAASVRSTRRFAHYLELLAIDFWFGMFYSIVLRFKLVSRLVAGFSLLTLVLHFVAVPAPGFLGFGINTILGVPLAFHAGALW